MAIDGWFDRWALKQALLSRFRLRPKQVGNRITRVSRHELAKGVPQRRDRHASCDVGCPHGTNHEVRSISEPRNERDDPMRAIIVIAVIVLVLGLVGWLRFSSPDGDPTIRVDTEKVRQDTSAIVEKSKEAVDGAARSIDRAAENVDASVDREPIEQ